MRRIDRTQGGVCRCDDAALRGLPDTQAGMVVLKVGQSQNDIPGFDDVIAIKRSGQQTVIGVDVLPLDFSLA